MAKKIVDDKAFRASLAKMEKKMVEIAKSAMVKSIETLKTESQALAPYKTGELEGNVTTEVVIEGDSAVGSVQFNVGYAAVRHNKLDTIPGPGTASKGATNYGTPGPNYLLNPGAGLGRDGTYQKNFADEYNKE